MLDITVDTPIGKQTIRAKDHQANRAQFWGKMTKDREVSVRGHGARRSTLIRHRSWIDGAHARGTAEGQDPSRLSQERDQGARHPRAPWLRAAARSACRSWHDATGLNVSTAFRLLQTLMAAATSSRSRATAATCWGPGFFQMGSAYLQGSDLAAIARPHLEALRDEVGETAYLVIFSQGEIVQLCKADGKQAVSASVRSMVREPAYCTATGKVLLVRAGAGGARQLRGGRRAADLHAANDRQQDAAAARDRQGARTADLPLDAEEYRAEPVLRERSGARPRRRAARSPRSASPCPRCASSARSFRAGASGCGPSRR